MQNKICTLIVVLVLMTSGQLLAQQINTDSSRNEQHSSEFKHSIGSSLFLFGNLDTKEPPLYFQLNYSYYLNPKNVIIAEAITWAYYHPLGIKYWDSSDDEYPGKIRSFGVGIGYQHFHWKGLFSTIQFTPSFKTIMMTPTKKFNPVLCYGLNLGQAIDLSCSTIAGSLNHR